MDVKRTVVRLLPIILIGGILVPTSSPAATLAWPMFQHNNQHTGRTTLVGPSGTDVIWTFPLAREPGFPVTGADGTIYLPVGTNQDGDGFLYAIDPDGTQKWSLPLPGGPASTAPAIGPDGTIYVHMNGGEGNVAAQERVWAVNPNGTQKWERNLGTAFTSSVQSSPAVAADGAIWVGSLNTNLYALDPEDGDTICSVSPSVSSIASSPAIAPDGTVYVIDSSTHLFAVQPDCNIDWEFQLSDDGIAGGNDQSPAIAADGTIWAPSIDENVYALNANGTFKCRFEVGETVRSSPAIAADGTIYVSADGLYALNPTNCSQKWAFKPFGYTFSSASPIIDGNGNIYVRESFTAYSVAPSGVERWTLSVSPSGFNGDPTAAIGMDDVLLLPDGGFFDNPNRLRAIGGGGDPGPSPSPDPSASPTPTESPSPDPTVSPTPDPDPEPDVTASSTTLKVVKKERRVVAKGQVSPDHAGRRVVVKFFKRKGGRFVRIAKKRPLLNFKSRYRARFARPNGGRCLIKVRFRGDDDHFPSGAKRKFRC